MGGVSGLGLGLYVCSKILKRHDSKLIIESIPGEGSKFSFSLNTI
ncbi:ATP-binding protein [Chryseobacterium indoltheticum]